MSASDDKEEINLINTNLKTQLFHILALVDQSILAHYTKQFPKTNISIEYSNTESNMNKRSSFQSKLYFYQSQIKEANEKISQSLRVSKLNQKETKVKNNQAILSELTKQNEMLNRIKVNQKKSLEEITNSEINQSHKASIIYKNKHLKDEIRITKDYHKSSLNKIREQNNEIANLNSLIQLINDNLEYLKEQSGTENRESKNDKSDIIKELEKKAKKREKIINEDMNYYLSIMNKYDRTLLGLDQEISLIKVELKHKDELIRINNLKIKELKKIELNQIKTQRKNDIMINKQQLKKRKPFDYDNDNVNVNDNNDNVNDNVKRKTTIEQPFEDINIIGYNPDIEQPPEQKRHSVETNNNVIKQIEVLRKDIEDVLNSDIEYRYNILDPKEQQAFNQQYKGIQLNKHDDRGIRNEIDGNKLVKKNNMKIIPMKDHQENDSFGDSINEEIKSDNSMDQFNSENNQIKDNEYHGIETEDKRRPFGTFEFPKLE